MCRQFVTDGQELVEGILPVRTLHRRDDARSEIEVLRRIDGKMHIAPGRIEGEVDDPELIGVLVEEARHMFAIVRFGQLEEGLLECPSARVPRTDRADTSGGRRW